MNPPQPPAHPLRVLYAEDEPNVAMMTRMLLRAEGFEVEHAANGREALEKFDAAPSAFHAVLTDDSMPVMSGVQLTEALRERGFTAHVVVYSGVVDGPKARLYQALGVAAIVHKLDPLDQLISALRAAAKPHA